MGYNIVMAEQISRRAIVTTERRVPELKQVALDTGTDITFPPSNIFTGPAREQTIVSVPLTQYPKFINEVVERRRRERQR